MGILAQPARSPICCCHYPHCVQLANQSPAWLLPSSRPEVIQWINSKRSISLARIWANATLLNTLSEQINVHLYTSVMIVFKYFLPTAQSLLVSDQWQKISPFKSNHYFFIDTTFRRVKKLSKLYRKPHVTPPQSICSKDNIQKVHSFYHILKYPKAAIHSEIWVKCALIQTDGTDSQILLLLYIRIV